MGGAQWLLEIVLLLLLAATLFHALRLERALGVLKRDRAVLEELVEGFNDSTRQAESGIERLRMAADGAGRQMARQIETAQRLRDDLTFLTERSDRLAERLESAVRSARMFADGAAMAVHGPAAATGQTPPPAVGLSQLFLAQVPPAPAITAQPVAPPMLVSAGSATEPDGDGQPRLRSQAERDLLRALRAGR
jgi:hypothetical protein